MDLSLISTRELVSELRRRKEAKLRAEEEAKKAQPLCRNCKFFDKSMLDGRYEKGYCTIRRRYPHAKQIKLLEIRKQTRGYYTCDEFKNEHSHMDSQDN